MDAQWSRSFGLSKLILEEGREVAIMKTRGVGAKIVMNLLDHIQQLDYS